MLIGQGCQRGQNQKAAMTQMSSDHSMGVNSGQDIVQDKRMSPKGETVNVKDSIDQTSSILSDIIQ